MKTRTRYGLAGSISLVAHLALVLWGALTFDWGLDMDTDFELEFKEVELMDLDAAQALQAPPPEPPAPAAPEPTPPEPEGDQPQEPAPEEAEPEPEPRFGEGKSKVDKLAPPTAKFSMMLANQRIKKLPFADYAADIMAPQVDFEYLVLGGGFDPWDDFDYIVIASTNMYDYRETFLAVQYRLSREELKAGVERAAASKGEVVVWERRAGMDVTNPRPADPEVDDDDPRYFMFLPNRKVAAYVQPKYIEHILSAEEGSEEAVGKPSAGDFVRNITRIKRFAKQEPDAGLHLVMQGLSKAASGKLPGGMKLPEHMEVLVSAKREPEVVIKIRYEEKEHAKIAERFWKNDVAKLANQLTVRAFIGDDYKNTEIAVEGKTLTLRAVLPEDQTNMYLREIANSSRKQMRRTKEDIEVARKQRERMKELRKQGLSVSEAMEQIKAEREGREPEDDDSQFEEKNTPDAEEPDEVSEPEEDETPGPVRDTDGGPDD